MKKFTIYAGIANDIKKYVTENIEKVNYTNALVLPNRIVLLVGSGQVQMWDNIRKDKAEVGTDVEYAIETIYSMLCLWYVDDLAQQVYNGKAFVCPNGHFYTVGKFKFTKDEEGYPTLSEDEMMEKFMELTKERNLWTSEEMKSALGIEWDVRKGK